MSWRPHSRPKRGIQPTKQDDRHHLPPSFSPRAGIQPNPGNAYDVLGRRTATWLPDDDPNQAGAATVTYRYLAGGSLPFTVQTGRRKDAGGGSFGRRAYQWQIYDGLGRLIQTQSDFDRSNQVIRAVDVNELVGPCVTYGRSPGFSGVTAGSDRIQASHFAALRNSIQAL